MRFLPRLGLAVANHWILLAIYAAALMLAVASLRREKRASLFADPRDTLQGTRKLLLRLGQVLAVILIALEALTPLYQGPIYLTIVGFGLYLVGASMVVVSIIYFGRARDGQPVVEGPYRFSRNPQWVGLFCALLGIAISSASWLFVMMVIAVGVIYHIQILGEEQLCRASYGQVYEEYARSVPRYLLVR